MHFIVELRTVKDYRTIEPSKACISQIARGLDSTVTATVAKSRVKRRLLDECGT